MSLFKKMFRDKPTTSPYSARDSRQLDSTDDSTDNSGPVTRGAARREVVHVVLRETMRHHGIPSDWIESKTLSMMSGDKVTGTYVTLVVRDGFDRLLPYIPAFQASFRNALERFDPRLTDWLRGLAWEFEGDLGSPETMPPAKTWATPAQAPAAPQTEEVDASAAAALASADDDLQNDLKALFAIRDAALSEASGKGTPTDFQETRPGI